MGTWSAVKETASRQKRRKQFVGQWIWKHLRRSSVCSCTAQACASIPQHDLCTLPAFIFQSHTAFLIKIFICPAAWLKILSLYFSNIMEQQLSVSDKTTPHSSGLLQSYWPWLQKIEGVCQTTDSILNSLILGISALTVTSFLKLFNPQSFSIHEI